MSLIHADSGQKKSDTRSRVSWRTLILMVELLVAVVAFEYLTTAQPAQATAIWLAGDCHTASCMQPGIVESAATAPGAVTTGEDMRQP